MPSYKGPSHISLPTPQQPSDVFSSNNPSSALDTSTTADPTATPPNLLSPDASPFGPSRTPKPSSGLGLGAGSSGKARAGSSSGGPGGRGRFVSAGAALQSGGGPTGAGPSSVGRTSFVSRRMSRNSWAGRGSFISPRLGQSPGNGIGGILDEAGLEVDQKPAIPSLAVGIRPAYSTPLPVLPMIVLCIAMLSEFLSANTPTPFLLQMVEGFFLTKNESKENPSSPSEIEGQVGLWTGNLVSVFFITQFLTSLLWSGIADRYGRRAVLVTSMLGSALTVIAFGTSGSLAEAICIRLCQGIFGGTIGVFRGSIRDITDSTNETRAYALLGFSWGMGGVVGPILGGVFESPAKNYPNTFFGKIELFKEKPYLLPCLLAASILTVGALLATRLSWDGGPRRSKIALPIEKDDSLNPDRTAERPGSHPHSRTASPTPAGGVAESIRHKASTVFNAAAATVGVGGPANGGQTLTPQQARLAALRDQEAEERSRRASRGSVGMGTAYGYGGVRRKHETLAARRGSVATIRAEEGEQEVEEEHEQLTLAQRFLIANEENTFNINDLWVSAAIASDTAVFEDEDEGDDTEDPSGIIEEESEVSEAEGESHQDFLSADTASIARRTPTHGRNGSPSVRSERSPEPPSARSHLTGLGHAPGHRAFSVSRPSGQHAGRKFSTNSGNMPAIFANTGLQTPPVGAGFDYDPMGSAPASPGFESVLDGRGSVKPVGGLSAIQEGSKFASNIQLEDTSGVKDHPVEEPAGSSFKLLPLLIILQYGLLAFHDTVHGQVFLSFLVSPYKSGGLGLEPSSFSLLIALMCLFQLYYQFYLYPHLGPPRGRLNHLQMFRVGSCLFIPAYLTLPLIRAFASPDKGGGFVVMTLVTINMACRYCGGTFAYTSVMVLINAMSPPKVVGIANAMGQALVSLARFVGPVIGGAVWSSSIAGHPEGYAHGFYVVATLCLLQILLTYLIR